MVYVGNTGEKRYYNLGKKSALTVGEVFTVSRNFQTMLVGLSVFPWQNIKSEFYNCLTYSDIALHCWSTFV